MQHKQTISIFDAFRPRETDRASAEEFGASHEKRHGQPHQILVKQ